MDLLPFVFSAAVCFALVGLPVCSMIGVSWCVLMIVTRLLGKDEPQERDTYQWN